MNQIVDFFQNLFDTSDWPPRWHCGNWSEFHGWFYIVSDLLIWSAYFAIPLLILRYISRRQNPQFMRLYFLFAAFILACGGTHLLDAIMFWVPVYRLSALVRFLTGVVSWLTVFNLVRILPTAFTLKSASELEAEVSQRQQAEEALLLKNQQLNEAQEIARMGYWEWNVRDNQLNWSENMYKLYARPANDRDPLSYEQFLESVHPEDRSLVDNSIRQATESKMFPEFFHRIVWPTGEIRTMHARGEVILGTNGEVVKMLGTGQDVTEQQRIQSDLLQKSQQLEAANAELQKFVYIASHDLQEPLRKISTFASMFERENGPELNERGQVYLGKINNAAVRMQHLIEDLLQFSRLSNEPLTFESIDLNEVVEQVCSDLEIAITQSGAQVEIGPLPRLDANATQMRQLIQNLLSNALKFRKETEAPHVRVTATILLGSELPPAFVQETASVHPLLSRATQRFCQLSVEDHGIGFDEIYRDQIFLLFQRLHSKARYEGTGIGLAICQKIVAMHQGYLTVKSHPGQGTTFFVYLPLTQHEFMASVPDKQVESL